MKAICTRENFKKGISYAERMVSKQNSLPILNTILFEADKGSLKLSATNLEMGIMVRIGAKVDSNGTIAVPAKLISNFSANISDGPNVEIELIDQNLHLKCGRTKAIIKSLIANDFPLIPKRISENLLMIQSSLLRKIINRTAVSVSHGEVRQELGGIDVVFGKNELRFASTDSFRLTECVLGISEADIVSKEAYDAFIEKNRDVIVPANTLAEIGRILTNNETEKVGFAIEEGQLFFEIGNAKIVSRLINGKYPEYKHIMPNEFKTSVIGDKSQITNAVKLASLFSSGKTNEISMKIDCKENRVGIEAKNAESGENSTELDFESSGESQSISFNSRYLLDGINMADTDKIAILSNSEASPVAIKEVGSSGEAMSDYAYIVMPIRN